MSTSDGSHQPAPPRLRLNSGSGGDLLDSDSSSSDGIARLPSSRSLTGGRAGSLRSPSSQGQLHTQMSPSDPSELLLPPSRSRPRRFRDETPSRSPSSNGLDSRRTSWSSESASSRDSRQGPFHSPFDDSRAPSRAGSDDDGVNTQTVSEKYNILPSAGLLLYPEDVEKDDYLHNPDPNDKEGVKCAELFSKRGIVNLGGLLILTLGIAMLFIGYPILTFVRRMIAPNNDACSNNPACIAIDYPLLKNVRGGPIDPNTPSSAMTKKSQTGSTLKLVFSDEFEEEGRTFYPGDDPYFSGVNFWYGVTQDLEWYDPDAITTTGGVMTIQFDKFPNHGLNYRSGMLQSWNQLCFKGGHLEASISLPGRGDVVGFWPGFWALGNLGRPGYAATTDGMWPYSYEDVCDAGITANQSQTDGLNNLPGMRLPACTCDGEDGHPSPGISRSAPEIDVIEASVGTAGQLGALGSASQSFQVAPFDIWWQPDAQFQEIYDHSITQINSYQGGVYQQAISSLTNLNLDWYNGKQFQSYAFEYTPGADGYVSFFVGDQPTWKIEGKSLRPNGNVGQRVLPQEPMAIVSNFGMSNGFSAVNFDAIIPQLPVKMRFDYIRIYQDDDGELTCDPVGYPTTDYISQHPEAYYNWNKTSWAAAGYSKPKNALVDQCESSVEPSASKKRRGLWNCQNGRCNG
ncbi:glycoside hydrolase family 16 protein [Myriangium duriaei CBS 260.36]|uniref:Glycoside hydrolase family 16 protein n=1 Tax=Myriangium duriaei CBS 260.36 TaxID=1168546 RepID=A0A9P4J652_9PEZI|nr:glycoside hydrolase family 16 protein [Myriangium duriaei CBS 260.36]